MIEIEGFDISKLSEREREIFVLATEGLTDQQIANRAQISTSTVNSYWVRIRGKVGFFSRTELTSKWLRTQAQTELKALEAERLRYQGLAEKHMQDQEDVKDVEVYKAALEAMPEPILVTDEKGRILFASSLLLDLFGYEAADLIEQPIETLLLPSGRAEFRAHLAEFFHSPEPMRLGIDYVLYGRHKDGTRFRVMLLLGSAKTSKGRVATCIVRNFLTEIDTLRRRASAIALS